MKKKITDDELLEQLSEFNLIKYELSTKLKFIELYPILDLHIGDKFTDVKSFKKFIKFIKEKPYRFVTLQGDLMNNALKTSV
jgi:hypothetical protein